MNPDDPLHLNCPAFLHLLNPDTEALIKQASSLVHYNDGQMIHSRGDNKPGLSIVESGSVFAGITDASGKQLIAGVLGPGHCFGEFTLFTNLVRTHDVTAVGDTAVYQISSGAFMSLFEQHNDIAKAMLEATLYRLHILLESMDAIRRLPVLERCAKLLLIMSYTAKMHRNIPVKQEELANTVGVSRVSMGKALKELQNLGLIELGYGTLHIPDRAALVNWLLARTSDTLLSR